MMLPEFRQLYQTMQQEESAARQLSYLQYCGKMTNLQRAQLVVELFTSAERDELVTLLASKKRWVQMVTVQIYCQTLEEMQE